VLQLPLIVVLEQYRADQPDDRGFVGEDPDDVGTALDFLIEAFQRVGAVQFAAVRLGEVEIGQDIGLAGRERHLRPPLLGASHRDRQSLGQLAQAPLQVLVAGIPCESAQLGVDFSYMSGRDRIVPALSEVCEHRHPPVHFVAHRDFVREPACRLREGMYRAFAERCAFPRGPVQHRARDPADHHRHRQDRPETFPEDRAIEVVGDRRRSSVIGHGDGAALREHTASQPRAGWHDDAREVVGAGSEELAQMQVVVLDLAGEDHGNVSLRGGATEFETQCIPVTGAKQRR
jgi:hypothetical protein